MISRAPLARLLLCALPCALLCAILCGQLGACTKGTAAPPAAPTTPAVSADPIEAALADVEQRESALRASTDWAGFPSSDKTLGPDPINLVEVGKGRYLGALHGEDAVVLLDDTARELARLPAPTAPRALLRSSSSGGGDVLVVGDHGDLLNVRVKGDALEKGPPLEDSLGAPSSHARQLGRWLAELDILGHAVQLSRDGIPGARLVSDSPPFGIALRAADPKGEHALVAVGLIEDHPLDRTIGSFGYIDSFLRVYRVSQSAGGGTAQRIFEVNLSELGIVSPKAIAFVDDNTVLVAGSGSGRAALVPFWGPSSTAPPPTMVPALPGVAALVPTSTGFIGASPLLDAWVIVDEAGARAVRVPLAKDSLAASRTVESKLGEALAFTTIIAPRQKSEGALSRFTCEACHFEGGVDGRTHHTGRADIRATTRPLRGLFNNKPLFTRALDPNISRMVHAEFRVAGSNSPLDPWFALTPADAPWLSLLGVSGTQSPPELRRALMTFLRDFTPRTNPNVVGKGGFSDLEHKGAALFQQHCVSCHAARLVGDDPSTEVPFERWEPYVLQENGPIVWSSAERKKTGVEPYVHTEGARPSSLRRLDEKRPYFTNGAAMTLDDVLNLFIKPGTHQDKDMAVKKLSSELLLSDDEKAALRAFLVLL